MDDNHDSPHQDSNSQPENETQRLHRMVIPMILDILRSRGEQRNTLRNSTRNHTLDAHRNNLTDVNNDIPPPLIGEEMTDFPLLPSNSDSDDMAVDESDDAGRSSSDESDSASFFGQDSPPTTDQQGQIIPSPSGSSSPSRRPRYRLVVYFEERGNPNEEEARENDREMMTDSLIAPTRDDVYRPSRYVAIFSIDSDAHNMPIIHSAGLQQSPANFDDFLNHLFTSHIPKGTPPAKQEIIDSLPTTTYTHQTCAAQPKCAVCLEDFEEGAEMVVLPCSHRFHGDACVKPWLRMHSSCPVCRYEMPVDDAEYEQQRKERMASRPTPAPPSAQDVELEEPPIL